MKKNKLTNVLLGIIALNLTMITLISLDIFPAKANASNTALSNKVVLLNENGKYIIEMSPKQMEDLEEHITYECNNVITRVLFCLDGATISDGKLTTYCNQ